MICTKNIKFLIYSYIDVSIIIQVGRELSDERARHLAELEQTLKKENELKKEMEKYRDSDPEYIAQLKNEIEVSEIS